MKKSEIFFLKSGRNLEIQDPHAFLIYDKILARKPECKKIIKKFKYSMAVESGESLKSLESFSKIAIQIANRWKVSSRVTPFYVMGGGSLGDFGGFFASVYKRGIPLIHIPTTWLSAIDSAHGGKTALNLNRKKNQIGTFYPAERIYLIEEVFAALPAVRLEESLGEILKIALIEGNTLWKQVALIQQENFVKIWSLLPKLIQAKWKIVLQDPDEKKNLRHLLNLGHTVGHIVESEFHWPHGECVLYGIAFDLIMSLRQGHLAEADFLKIVSIPLYKKAFQSKKYLKFLSLKKAKLLNGLKSDKKNTNGLQIFHTFLVRPGQLRLQKIPLNLLVDEYSRQQNRAYGAS